MLHCMVPICIILARVKILTGGFLMVYYINVIFILLVRACLMALLIILLRGEKEIVPFDDDVIS